MTIISSIEKKKLLNQLGTDVITMTKNGFENLKEVTKDLLKSIADEVTTVHESSNALDFKIFDYTFCLKMFDTVSLSHKEDTEFFTEDKLLTDAKIKIRYTGRIIYYFKTDRIPNLVLSELLINEQGNFIFLSNIGWKSEMMSFRGRETYNELCKKMIEKGIEDAFFAIDSVWKFQRHFEDDSFIENQGTKIGFV